MYHITNATQRAKTVTQCPGSGVQRSRTPDTFGGPNRIEMRTIFYSIKIIARRRVKFCRSFRCFILLNKDLRVLYQEMCIFTSKCTKIRLAVGLRRHPVGAYSAPRPHSWTRGGTPREGTPKKRKNGSGR